MFANNTTDSWKTHDLKQRRAGVARNPPAAHGGHLAPFVTVQSIITCLSISRLCLLHPGLHSPSLLATLSLG